MSLAPNVTHLKFARRWEGGAGRWTRAPGGHRAQTG